VVGVATAGRVERGGAFCQRILACLAYADLAPAMERFVGNRADLEHCEKWATEST